MRTTYSTLLSIRIRWYSLSTARLIMRHWHWVILSMLFIPMGMTLSRLLQAAAFPLLALFSPNQSIVWYFSYILILQAIAITWVLLQKRFIQGGQFMEFISTLPVSSITRTKVNLTLLLMANSILSIIMICAVLISSFSMMLKNNLEILSVVTLLVLTLVAQLATLEKTLTILPLTFVADWLFAFSLTIDNAIIFGLITGCAIILSIIGVFLPPLPKRIRKRLNRQPRPNSSQYKQKAFFPVTLTIQLKALTSRASHSVMLIVSTLSLTIATFFYPPSLPTLVMIIGGIAFMLSGFYRALCSSHIQMLNYSNTLPLSQYFWVIRDIIFVTSIGITYLALILSPFLWQSQIDLYKTLFLFFTYDLLLATLRLPLLYGGRHTILLSVVLTASWAASVFFVIL